MNRGTQITNTFLFGETTTIGKYMNLKFTSYPVLRMLKLGYLISTVVESLLN